MHRGPVQHLILCIQMDDFSSDTCDFKKVYDHVFFFNDYDLLHIDQTVILAAILGTDKLIIICYYYYQHIQLIL